MAPTQRIVEDHAVRLEPQTASHADEMFTVLADPALYAYENAPPPSVDWLRERFARLESRTSADGTEQWLNWVVRLPSAGLIGFVQATVDTSGRAAIAYVLNSRFWGRGLAAAAVRLMLGELAAHHGVTSASAVLKSANAPSRRLLERLGFTPATREQHVAEGVPSDESLMLRTTMPSMRHGA